MPSKINRILIPLILLILLYIGNQTLASGEAPNNSTYLPMISHNPAGWIGPYGGTIVTIAADPSNPQIAYAGSFGSGVYKSTDGGRNWLSVNQGLSNLYVYSLAIDPTQPSTLYAGTYRNQVFKSSNGGTSWTWSGTGMQDQAIVYAIAIDPLNSLNLYAATRGVSNNDNPPWNGVVYRSIDGGQTWEPSLVNVGGMQVMDWAYSLAVNPKTPNQVFAATHENAPYRSNDYGLTWLPIHNGINDPSGRAIVISPQPEFSSILYHGVWHFDSVYKSINNGDLWTLIDHEIPNVKVYSMAIDPFSADLVYMATFSNGLLKTPDGGATWQNAGLESELLYSVVINPILTNNLLVGTSGDGLYRSADSSNSWQRSSNGINNANATSVALFQSSSTRIIASQFGAGVYQSANRGQTWSELNIGLTDKYVHDLVMDPAHPGLLYALTDTGGLFRIDLNTGNGWVKVGGGLPLTQAPLPAYSANHPFASLEMQEAFATPSTTNSSSSFSTVNLLTMIYAPSNFQVAYLGTGGQGAFKSIDGGVSWQSAELGGQTVYSLAVDYSDANLVYAATNIAGSMKYSADGGVSWKMAYLPVEFYSVAASPTEQGVVYAGTNSGVYRFQSGEWTPLGLSDRSVTVVAADPVRIGVIYAGTDSGAYYSTDNGSTWLLVDQSLTGHTIQSINFDQKVPSIVYFSTKTHGVYLAVIPF